MRVADLIIVAVEATDSCTMSLELVHEYVTYRGSYSTPRATDPAALKKYFEFAGATLEREATGVRLRVPPQVLDELNILLAAQPQTDLQKYRAIEEKEKEAMRQEIAALRRLIGPPQEIFWMSFDHGFTTNLPAGARGDRLRDCLVERISERPDLTGDEQQELHAASSTQNAIINSHIRAKTATPSAPAPRNQTGRCS